MGGSMNSDLSQLQVGYAGPAAVERCNPAAGLSAISLNGQVDIAVSGQPEFKEAIF